MEDVVLPQKPSPDDSGQATKQTARWTERKRQGSCNTQKNYYGVPFSQNPAQ